VGDRWQMCSAGNNRASTHAWFSTLLVTWCYAMRVIFASRLC
jgi:hypothetical protein